MNRARRNRAILATLLLWQLGLVLASPQAAFGAPSSSTASAVPPPCPMHASSHHPATQTLAAAVTRGGTGIGSARGKPRCCASDICKCSLGASGLLAASQAAVAFGTSHSALLPDVELPRFAERAAEPLRPPI